MITCPNCGGALSGGQMYCNLCSAKIPQHVSNETGTTLSKTNSIEGKQEVKMKYRCGKCGSELVNGETVCKKCGTKNKIPEAPVVNNARTSFCHNCGEKLPEGHQFCSSCGTKVENVNPAPVAQSVSRATSTTANVSTVAKPKTSTPKVNVQAGRYIGKKWFIKLAYKTFETDVEFFDEHMVLSQGTGFASISYKTPTQIQYKSVYGVDVKNQYSIPNVIFAIIVAILAVAMQVWVALLIAAVVLFLGKTAVATINHSGGQYVVPTEFLSDAEELRNKINMAINQSRG